MTGSVTGLPWTRADAAKSAALVALGCVVWAIGWFQVAEKPALEEQIAPFNVVIVGFMVVGVGNASWFLAGRRAVGDRRRSLLTLAAGAQVPAQVPSADECDRYVGSERFFHRAACPLVADRSWAPQARSEHECAGRVPCGVCAP